LIFTIQNGSFLNRKRHCKKWKVKKYFNNCRHVLRPWLSSLTMNGVRATLNLN